MDAPNPNQNVQPLGKSSRDSYLESLDPKYN